MIADHATVRIGMSVEPSEAYLERYPDRSKWYGVIRGFFLKKVGDTKEVHLRIQWNNRRSLNAHEYEDLELRTTYDEPIPAKSRPRYLLHPKHRPPISIPMCVHHILLTKKCHNCGPTREVLNG